MTQERYELEGNQFWVVDSELGLNLQGECDAAKLHGPSLFYDMSGQLLSKTWFFEGKKVGKAYRYYCSGELYSLERFIHGLPHLAQEYYYPDGMLKTMIQYDKGILHGETVLYWPDGALKRKCHFSHGKMEADRFYDEEENCIGAIEKALS